MKITVSVSELNDAIILKERDFIRDVHNCANMAVKSGGAVVFEQSFSDNSPPRTLLKISTAKELVQWQNNLTKIIKQLERIK